MKRRSTIEIDPHAVKRFMERHQKGLCFAAAREMLADLFRRSTLHAVERQGSREVYRSPEGILIGVEDGIVKTVLPLGSMRREYRPRKKKGRRRA